MVEGGLRASPGTKVAWVTEVPTAYRTPIFERLASEVSLQILYCSESDPWRGGDEVQWRSFEKVLPGVSLGGARGGMRLKLNASVWKRLSSFSPDVVIVGGYAHPTMQLAMLWCRRHGIPYVLHSESNDLTPRSPVRRWVKALLVKWAVRGAGAFLPVSSAAMRYLTSRGAHSGRMFVLPNIPDVQAIVAAVERSTVARGLAVLYVGRLVSAKDVPTLLGAYSLIKASHPGASLGIVGEGPLEGELKRIAAEQDLSDVTFHGFLSGQALIDMYCAASCFVLPSIYEPFGVVVLEAMAAGLPVVVSDRVGSAEDFVLAGKNGFVFSAGDSRELAAAVDRSLQDGADMGLSAREVVLRWDVPRGVGVILSALACARRE